VEKTEEQKMIEKLELKNFQSHKSNSISFDPHVTTIVGPSDVGKSAIIRSIQWVLQNKPSGEAFIREGSKKAAVRITIDGKKITRVRGKGKNAYRLNNDEFKAFGNDIPDPIVKILNISDLNFQSQHDSPFWFCETAGEVSRRLNSIVDLEVIDKTLSNILSTLRTKRTESNVISKRIKEIEERISEFSYFEQLDLDLKKIESQEKDAVEITVQQGLLQGLLDRAYKYKDTQELALKLIVDGSTALQAGNLWKGLSEQEKQLEKIVISHKNLQKIVKKTPPSLKELENKKDKLDNSIARQNELSDIVSKVILYRKVIKLCRKEQNELQKTIKDEIGETCPLCNQTMPSL